MSKVQFAILGAGAMGAIVGAHLARAGHSVAMLVRERRAKQIAADGLRITGIADFSLPVAAITRPADLKSADVFIVTTKAIDTAESLAPYRHAAIGTAFSLQNGVMKNELLGAAFPGTQILGALANFSGEMRPSGEVIFTRNVNLTLGDLDGRIGPQSLDIAKTIDASGLHSTAVANILGYEWAKFAAWVALAAMAVTTRSVTWKYMLDPGTALLVVRLIREVGVLANACDIEFTDESMFPVATMCRGTETAAVDIVLGYGAEFQKNSPSHRLSTLQDLEAHRPLELDETFGFTMRRAAELNLRLPLLESFYAVARVIDRQSATNS
jgi:2-dehydropantoate 2-reductase